MKIIEVENNKYEIIKDYKNGFDEEKFINHYTFLKIMIIQLEILLMVNLD